MINKIYISFNDSNASIQEIGKKAYGLFSVHKDLIPDFAVIKVNLFQLWTEDPEKANSILDELIPQIDSYFKGNNVIIRSSAYKENFEQRGYYESSRGNIQLHEVKNEIIKLWELNLPLLKLDSEQNFGLIIQKYITPVLLGHLSNERRLSKPNDKWFYEILSDKNEVVESNHFQVKNGKKVNIKYHCRTKTELIKTLKEITKLKFNCRIHIEWVWDGTRIWIVQVDFQSIINNNNEPGAIWRQKGKITKSEKKDFTILKKIDDSETSWKKADCVKTFKGVGLPIGEVYLLDGEKNLDEIYNNKINKSLDEDLSWLLSSPIVIRIDINKKEKHNLLLPRTETLFKKSDVITFLKSNIQELLKQEVGLNEVCFLLHRFIISKSCALAYSKPGIPRTRVDSTWGIVDGLYYHPHDSFEYNSSNKRIKERIRCKTEYLDVDENGNWVSNKCNEKYDWRNSLTKREIAMISSYNEKLASYLEVPVTVMYFVGVFKNTGYPEILPWYYTTEEIPESSEKFSEIIFSEKKIVILRQEDFNRFKVDFIENKFKNKITLQLKILPDLLRDRDFLEEIGSFSFEHHIPIEIEGSILSHPYYILKKQKAIVKAKDAFDPSYQKQEFYKLVRDKIPVIINSKGEFAKTLRITSAQTLELIKQKLIEEAFECFWESKSDNIIEELADIYELLRGASKIFEIDIDEIEKIADIKREKRGGFDESIFLIETKEKSLIEVKKIKTNEKEIFEKNNNKLSSDKESLIPIYQKSTYIKDTLSVPYIPSIINSTSKIREEFVTIDSNSQFLVSFDKMNINIRVINKQKDKDKNQLSIDFGDHIK